MQKVKETVMDILEDEKKRQNNNSNDRLALMFKQQHDFQVSLDNDAYLYNIPFLKEMILATHCELSEALQEIPWKSWKQPTTWNPTRVKEEAVDIMHFLINICLASGMEEDELFTRFTEKGRINKVRQKGGY